MKMRSKEGIITIALLLLITYTLALSLVSQVFTAGQTVKTLSSTGSIQIQTTEGVGVYSDAQCTAQLSTLAWGTLQPGGNKNITCYIKNEGDTPTTLSLESSNWNPTSASEYLTLNWDYNDQPINIGSSVEVTLTLRVASNITGISSFTFDITIVGYI
jgi:hypothetical protein